MKIESFKKQFKAAVVIVALFVALLSTVSSYQIASAWSPVPSGCTQTYYGTGCQRCGFLWLWTQSYQRWEWSCPNGGGGSHQTNGVCNSCP